MINSIRINSIDFVHAIHRLVGMPEYHKEIKKMGVTPSAEVEALIETLSTSVSMRLFEDLKIIYKKYYLDALFTAYALNNPEMMPEEIIEELKAVGPDALYDAYVKLVVKPKEPGEHGIKARIDEILDNNTTQFIMTYTQLKRFKTESKDIYAKMIDTFSQFNKVYKIIEPDVEAIYAREIHSFELDMADENKFRNSFLMIQFDGSTELLKKIDVCVSILGEFNLMYNFSEDHKSMKMIVGFGMRNFASDQEATLAQEVFKTLGDPTKLLMIQMASKEAVCAKDFADRLDLSKATISHHIGILIGLKLFTLNLQDGKKMYYSTNKELLKRLFDNFIGELK